jgi:hypothetical protein
MSPNIDGVGRTMLPLPGSVERMVAGPLTCMFHRLSPAVKIGDWMCQSVYMNVPYKKPVPYSGEECKAVFDAIVVMRDDTHAASALQGDHIPGHPLPGVYTCETMSWRVDFRKWQHGQQSYLWAALYKR